MFIYLITNLINGKYYVGKTQKENLSHRWKQHLTRAEQGLNKYLYTSMRKHGISNFIIEPLTDNVHDKKSLKNLEKLWITLLDTCNPEIGYNKSKGGDGGAPWTEDRKVEWSKRWKGIPKSLKHRQSMSLSFKGRVFSEEHKRNLSISKLGKSNPKIAGENNPRFGKPPVNLESLTAYNRFRPRNKFGRYLPK